MIENKDEISLDKANNVFVGPHDYFKIVIDEFGNQSIPAWHIEDKDGNSTGNLAGRSQGQHIDAVVSDKCRSTGHFFSRVYSTLYREALANQGK